MRLNLTAWTAGLIRNLGSQSAQMSIAGERLSSGRRLNRAADDPAGLAPGMRFATMVLSTRMAMQNIAGGISLLSTADAALGKVTSLLQRARQLAQSAANGTLTDSDRADFQTELEQVRAAIDGTTSVAMYNGRPIFGTFGRGYATLRQDLFTSSAGVASFSGTSLQSGAIGLTPATSTLYSQTFGAPVTATQGMAAAISDTFANLSRVDSGLTTALVDTVGGLVRLSQAITLRDSQTVNIAQPAAMTSLWSDSFTDTLGINGGLTTAAVDTATGRVALPSSWGAAASGSPAWQLSQVLNQRFFDTFTGLGGTNGGATTALVDTVAGQVVSPATTAALWSESPGATMPGTAPSWSTLGSDTFVNLAQVAANTGVNIDTLAGTVSLLTQSFTVGSDSFTSASNIDSGLTTANVNTATGDVTLNSTLQTESYGDSFTSLAQIGASSGLTVDTATGTVTLSQSSVAVSADSFGDASMIGAGSTGVYVSGGQLQLDQTAQLNNKEGTTAVFNPGTGGGGNWDSKGVLSASVVDLGGGTLRMYYVSSKNNGSTPQIGYATSTDGGKTWSAGSTMGLTTGITAGTQVAVMRDSGGTYHMFYTSASKIMHRTSATGTGGWSGATTAVNGVAGGLSIVQDGSGSYRMFYEQTAGSIAQVSAASLNGPWTTVAGFTNISGTGPQIVNEGNRYSLYYTSGGQIVRATSTDLLTFSAGSAVVTTGTGWDANAVKTGGAVYDSATGTTRMIYLGKSSGGGEWSAGLAYTTERSTGTLVSTVTNTADTISNLTLNANATLNGGSITYQVSADGGTTWQTVTSGSNISVAAGQQVMVKATLTNASPLTSTGPTLQDYSLSANLYGTSGQLTSTTYNFTHPVDNFTLNGAATSPAGTSLSYEYSTDGGTTWSAITPGVQVSLGSAVSQVQVRANFATTDRGFSATLADYTISGDYTQYNASEYLYTKNYTFTDSIDQFTLSATQSGTVNWEYSTDGGTTWQAASLGANALGSATGQLQLRAQLVAGGGGATTPVLSDYSVDATRHTSSGSFTSTDITFAQPVDQLRLNTTATAPGGSSISYEVSTDGGTTWQAITGDGTALALGSATTSVKLRASLATTDGYYTPTLSDYTLEGQSTGYPASSSWTSAVHNFGYNVQNVTLNVTENKPAGTGISYEISTDGGTSWAAVTPGSNIAVTPGASLMLRANMSTTDPSATPTLVSYSLTSDEVQSTSVWTSAATALGYNATAVKLTANAATPSGTGVAYEVSADGGTTWQAITPGSVTALGTPGSNLLLRATLSSTDPYATAALQDLKLETYDYQTSGTFTSGFTSLSSPTTEVKLDSVTATTPGGTGVTYEVTNDGGTTWQAVAAGGTATFATAGSQVGFRAMMTSDGGASPLVSSYSLSVPGYSSGKYVYSTVHATGGPITNVTLNATENKPVGTSILYDISTDGGSTWTAVTAGSNTVVPAGTDLMMRAYLFSSDPGLTPELLDYSIETNQPTAGYSWTSGVVNTGSNVNQVRLNVTESKPAGTDITYQISSDGGTTWQAATAGSWLSVAPGSQLMVKALFSSTSPTGAVATLQSYTLETRDYTGPQTLTTSVTDIGHDVTQLQLDVNATEPAGTGISYELSNDGGATWVAATPGAVTNFATAGRQIMMRALLSGTNTDTPSLQDYTIQAPMYSSSTTYTSPLQSLATPVTNITLNANSTTPAGTSISYQVSADGGTTWQSVTPGVNAVLTNPGTQLLARAILASTDGRQTAELTDWSLSTSAYAGSGSFTSTTTALTSPVSTVRFSAGAILNGGSISYELSNDGGTTWVAATAGSDVSFAAAGSQLALRATFTSPGGGATPLLLDYTIQGLSNDASLESSYNIQSTPLNVAGVSINLPWVTEESLGLSGLDISTQAGALAAQPAVDGALSQIINMRSQVGAQMSVLEHEMNRQVSSANAKAEAASNYIDADMARESLNFVKSQLQVNNSLQTLTSGMESRRQVVSRLLGGLPGVTVAPSVGASLMGGGLPGFGGGSWPAGGTLM